jgi:peptidyl-prolyl cis-trans isomerase D
MNSQLLKLVDRAKVLNDLKKAAAEMKITLKTSDLVGKDAQVPDLGAMNGPGAVTFTLAKGAISNPIDAGQSGIVLSVTDKEEPTAEDTTKNFAQTREQLLNDQHEQVFQVYVANLTEKYQKSGAIRYTKKQPAPVTAPSGN